MKIDGYHMHICLLVIFLKMQPESHRCVCEHLLPSYPEDQTMTTHTSERATIYITNLQSLKNKIVAQTNHLEDKWNKS